MGVRPLNLCFGGFNFLGLNCAFHCVAHVTFSEENFICAPNPDQNPPSRKRFDTIFSSALSLACCFTLPFSLPFSPLSSLSFSCPPLAKSRCFANDLSMIAPDNFLVTLTLTLTLTHTHIRTPHRKRYSPSPKTQTRKPCSSHLLFGSLRPLLRCSSSAVPPMAAIVFAWRTSRRSPCVLAPTPLADAALLCPSLRALEAPHTARTMPCPRSCSAPTRGRTALMFR